MNRLITLTQARLDRLKTPKGGYNAKTLRSLGVSWPPAKGWKKELVGKKVTLGAFVEAVQKTKNRIYMAEIEAALPNLNPPVFIAGPLIPPVQPQTQNPPGSKKKKKLERREKRRKQKLARARDIAHKKVSAYGALKLASFIKEIRPSLFNNPELQKAVETIETGAAHNNKDSYVLLSALRRIGKAMTTKHGVSVIETKDKLRRQQKLYVIRVEGKDELKIGISKTPAKRLKELQTGNPYKLYLDAEFEVALDTRVTACAIEAKLHKKFKKRALQGEWFSGIETSEIIENTPTGMRLVITQNPVATIHTVDALVDRLGQIQAYENTELRRLQSDSTMAKE